MTLLPLQRVPSDLHPMNTCDGFNKGHSKSELIPMVSADVSFQLSEEQLARIPDSIIDNPDEIQKHVERALDIGLRILQQI